LNLKSPVTFGPLPDNFCAMTTVTSIETIHRVRELQLAESACRGLSLEPLWSRVTDELNLEGIDWVIVGGESGKRTITKTFDLEWLRDLRQKCNDEGVALFVKQLGRNPVVDGEPLTLRDPHGGDWDEWDEEFRVREMPEYFHGYRK
ncbi:MAG: DUF5131 family protein, partial [Planctomycetales bacterium]|nr:DUF5131 family protein [Planctomycetales bacterium]